MLHDTNGLLLKLKVIDSGQSYTSKGCFHSIFTAYDLKTYGRVAMNRAEYYKVVSAKETVYIRSDKSIKACSIDEAKNRLGSNRCSRDDECNGERYCSGAGWCNGDSKCDKYEDLLNKRFEYSWQKAQNPELIPDKKEAVKVSSPPPAPKPEPEPDYFEPEPVKEVKKTYKPVYIPPPRYISTYKASNEGNAAALVVPLVMCCYICCGCYCMKKACADEKQDGGAEEVEEEDALKQNQITPMPTGQPQPMAPPQPQMYMAQQAFSTTTTTTTMATNQMYTMGGPPQPMYQMGGGPQPYYGQQPGMPPQGGPPMMPTPPPMPEAPPAQYEGYDIDYTINFIEGANYNQIDIGYKQLSYQEALQICVEHAKEADAYGFFYQKHAAGMQIVGLYQTEEDMAGNRVKHGHPKGLVATKTA